jgi:tetraacyldisaccharide 4'-kinase
LLVVGSVLAGGAGKTPVCAEIAKKIQSTGIRVGILCHAVHGKVQNGVREVFEDTSWRESSDEAVWLKKVSQARVWVTRDRFSAWEILSAKGDLDLLISDDGFEDPRLNSALRIMLPPPLRADRIWDLIPAGKCRSLLQDHAGVEECRAVFSLVSVHGFEGNALQGPFTVVCGIGDPDRFVADLKRLGMEPYDVEFFPDHSVNIAQRVESLLAQGISVVTTEKDLVRLPAKSKNHPNLFVAYQKVKLPNKYVERLIDGGGVN